MVDNENQLQEFAYPHIYISSSDDGCCLFSMVYAPDIIRQKWT